MAETHPNSPAPSSDGAKSAEPAKTGRGSSSGFPPSARAGSLLRSGWPIPAMIVAAGALGAGLYSAWNQRPKADPSLPLQAAERLVAIGQFAEAIDELNGPALGFKDSGLASRQQEARFHLARARAFAGQQAKLGISRIENHQRIVEDYKLAEELGIGDVAGEHGGTDGHGASPAPAGKSPYGGSDHAAHPSPAGEGHAVQGEDVASMQPDHAHDAGHGSATDEGLTLTDRALWIESLIALGSIDDALTRISRLPGGAVGPEGERQRERKLRLTRLLVEHNLHAADPKQRREELTLDLLARMSTDPELSQDDHAWVLSRQAELLLALNRVEEAITKLLRELQRLQDVPASRQGELYVLLGKAYVEVGQDADAVRQLDAADRLLATSDSGNPLRADAAVLLGRLTQRSAVGKEASALEPARERYSLVTSEFRGSRAFLPAVLGLAEIDASCRDFDRSIERYEEVSQAIVSWKPTLPPVPREAGRDVVTASLMARWRELFEEAAAKSDVAVRTEALNNALRFAQTAETLYPPSGPARQAPPAELLLGLGQTHRRIADDIMDAARAASSADFTVKDLDPATRAEVKRHYLSAGEAYRRHAERVSSEDSAAFSASLWIAADSFDLAGDLDEAARAFGNFIDGAADTDPNRPAAKFRLAQIFEAQGDHKAAQSLLEGLRSASGDERQPTSAGEWADRAILPLALCYLADGDPTNDERAEQLMLSVLSGRLIGPDARDYRDALIELGNLYYAGGRYTDAISRFEEVVKRYPIEGAEKGAGNGVATSGAESPAETASPRPRLPAGKLATIRFKLADSHRLEAGKIARTLEGALPQVVENQLKAERIEHLTTAMAEYAAVRTLLESVEPVRMTELEKTFLRNAYFSIGDCAFDLGDYGRAVAAYDAAALRYVDDPSSLVAMVQIVNAYVAQGQPAQARAANERARRQLARFPDEVWNRADLPMERKHWERWLESRQMLETTAAAGDGN